MKNLIDHLRKRRALLLKAYVIHVGWFASTCAFAATDTVQIGLATSLWLALLTMPPVILYTISVHKACRAIDPSAKTAGWVHVIFFTIVLTPLEAGLVLPAKNLLVSPRILRACDKALTLCSSGTGQKRPAL